MALARETGGCGARWHNECRGAFSVDIVTMATLKLLFVAILHLAQRVTLATERVCLGREGRNKREQYDC
jgi:hypothetical protein